MAQCLRPFGGETNNSESNALRRNDCEFLNSGKRCRQVCGQDWEPGFTQPQAKRSLAVIEFMITYGARCISDLIHSRDSWDSFEFIGEKSSCAEISGIQNKVRLCVSYDCSDFGHTAKSSFWQKLSVKIVRVHDDDVRGRLRHYPKAGGGPKQHQQKCKKLTHEIEFYDMKKLMALVFALL